MRTHCTMAGELGSGGSSSRILHLLSSASCFGGKWHFLFFSSFFSSFFFLVLDIMDLVRKTVTKKTKLNIGWFFS